MRKVSNKPNQVRRLVGWESKLWRHDHENHQALSVGQRDKNWLLCTVRCSGVLWGSVTTVNVYRRGQLCVIGSYGRPVNWKIRIHSTPLEYYDFCCASREDETKQNKTCLQTFLFQLQTSNNERLLINFYVCMNVPNIQTHSTLQWAIYRLTANEAFPFCRPTPPTYWPVQPLQIISSKLQ